MNKFKKILVTTTTGALLFATSVMPVSAAPLNNGSFELGTDPGSFTQLADGSTVITNWTIGGNGVDYIGTYWTASDGSRSIDLSATDTGSVSQTFTTIVGVPYKVTFDMAGNPAGGNQIKNMTVSAGGAPTAYTFDITGHNLVSMGWTSKTFNFVATSTSTTLTFTSLEANAFGPALDNVVITESAPAECTGTYGAPIFGTSGSDNINGTSGNDLIFAMGGDDIINAGSGDDCVVAGDGNDQVNAGNGNDVVIGGDGDDLASGGNGKDDLYGNTGSDTLNGGNGNDNLWGNDDNDTINGGNGADTAMGGTGDDTMSGGTGTDDLRGEDGDDTANGGNAADVCDAEIENSCESDPI